MKTRGFRFERHVRNPLGARVLAGIYLGRAKKRGRKESGSPGFEAEKNPKEKETCVCMREREYSRGEDWKTYAKEKEREHRRRMKRVCERAASGPCAREVVALHKRFPTLCGGFGYGSV